MQLSSVTPLTFGFVSVLTGKPKVPEGEGLWGANPRYFNRVRKVWCFPFYFRPHFRRGGAKCLEQFDVCVCIVLIVITKATTKSVTTEKRDNLRMRKGGLLFLASKATVSSCSNKSIDENLQNWHF